MAKLHVTKVDVLDNPANFMTKLDFEITFECTEELPEDVEWKLIYVGSADSEEFDQVLDTVYIGPVPEGRHKFVLTADPPNPQKIPVADVVGVTVILLKCSYRSQEFIQVGYYVNNEYLDPELLETPPEKPDFDKLQRNILASNPRVTRFKINWDGASTSSIGESPQPGTSEQGNEEENDGQDDNRSPTKEEFERPILPGDDAVKHIDVKNDDSKLQNSAEVENISQNGQTVTTKSPHSLRDQALANQLNQIKSSGDDKVKQIDVQKDDSKLPNSAEVENSPQNGQAVTTKSPPSLTDQALADQFNQIKSGLQSSGNIEPLAEQARSSPSKELLQE